jgi:cell division septal protein FtsQ
MAKKRPITRSKRAAGRRRNSKFFKTILALFSLGVIILSLSFISKSSFLQIEKVEVTGNAVTNTADIESLVFSHLEGLHAGLFSKGNIMLYPKNEIEETVRQNFPRIESLSLSANTLTSIKMALRERGPHALWCKGASSQCYFIDSSGFIFASAPTFTSGVYLVYRGDIVKEEPLGQTFLPQQFKALSLFVGEVNTIGFPASEIKVLSDGDIEITTAQGKLIASIKRDLVVTAENLRLFWEENKNTLTRFSYIDMRFGNKVFYK